MNVLVGCEFSGIVRDAFLDLGHNAMSCDFLPSESDKGEHYQGNVLDLLHERGLWDLIIMHPDCTAVCNAGNGTYGEGCAKYPDRIASAYWIGQLWFKCRVTCKKVCFENPPGVLPNMAGMPIPQYVQPYQHGHLRQKRTGLYLHGLPRLKITNNVYIEMMKLPQREREAVFFMGPSETRWMDRARTETGIASAMAKQWGNL